MMIMLKSTHDRAMAVKDAEIRSLKQAVEFHAARARSAQAAHRVANEVASQRAGRIFRLEADLAEQSTKITTLSNLNTKLERELRPFRAPRPRAKNGWYLSDAQAAALARQEQAA